MNQDEQIEKSEDKLNTLFALLGGIFLIWIFSIAILKCRHNDWRISAEFSDSFGAISSLFSGLAFAGIIYTILLQKKELALQRNELKLTRTEFKTQNTTLKLQRFENTFFNLLTLHHQIVDSMDITVTDNIPVANGVWGETVQSTETYNGRDVFKKTYERLVQRLNIPNADLNETYINYYNIIQTDFGHYFKNLYRMFKLVDESDFSYGESSANLEQNFNEKYKYTSIIRAQLSDYELLMLFYNCLSDNGNKKFKPLIEKYTLFKNIPDNKLHDPSLMDDDYYKGTAFEKEGEGG